MSEPIIEVDRFVSPEVILKYSCKTYWIKIIDGHDMDYFTPSEPGEGQISGFIHRELWRYDTEERKEAFIIFNMIRRLIDRLDEEDIHLVRLKEEEVQISESATGITE